MKRLNLKLLLGLLITCVVIAGTAYGVWSYQMSKNSSQYLKWAEEAHKKGDVENEVLFYRRYLLYDEHNAKILGKYALVIAEVARGPQTTAPQVSAAIQACTRALRENDKDTEVRQSLADLYMRIGRAQDAIAHLERLLKDQPQNVKALKMLAQCNRMLGNDDAAEKLFRRAIETDKKDVDAYGGIAEIYQQKKDDEAVNKTLDEMVANNPDKWQAYLRRYQFRLPRGLNDDLRADLQQAIKLGPTELDVLLSAANSAVVDRDFDKAREYLESAKKHHPKSETVYTALAQTERYAGRTPEAIQQLESGLKQHPDSIAMLLMLAELRLNDGKVDQTYEIIDKLEKLHWPADRIDYLRALIMMQKKDYTKAITVLNRIRPGLASLPGIGQQIDLRRAQCYHLLNQLDEEIRVLRQMLLDDPLSRSVRIDLARALLASGDVEEAVQELGDLVEAGDENAEKMMFQAVLSKNLSLPEMQRNWTVTDQLMKKIVEREPDSAAIFAAHVEYLIKKGDADSAKQLLDKGREKFGKEPLYWLSLANQANAATGADAALKVLDDGTKEIGQKLEFRSARVSFLSQKGDDASKKALAEMAANVTDLPESDQRTLLNSIGMAFYILRDFDQAKKVYGQLSKISKDDLNLQIVIYTIMRDADDDAGMQAALEEIQRIAGENNSYTQFCKAARIVSEVQKKQLPIDTLDEALTLVDKAAAQRPNWGAVWRLRGEIDERRGNIDKSIEDFQKAVNLGDTNPGVVRRLAALLLTRNRADELKAVVDKIPNGRDLLGPRLLAVLKIQEGEVTDALPIAREAAKEDRNSYITQLWLAEVLKSGGEFDDAEAAYKRACELAPDVADTWLSLGRFYASQDRPSEVDQVIQQIEAKVKPEQRELALALLREAAHKEDAEKDYLAALEKNPGDLKTLEMVAAYYFRMKKPEKTREYLNKLSELGKQAPPDQKPYVERAHRALADMYAATRDPKNLVAAIQTIDLNADPDLSSEDKSLKAKYYAQLGDLASRETAIRLLEDVLAQEPERGADRLLLAELFDRDGNWRRAKEMMDDLLASPRHKKDAGVIAKYAAMLLQHEETAEAAPLVTRLQDMEFGNDPVFIVVKAHLLKQKHQPDQAIELVKSQINRPLAPSGVPQLKQAADQLVGLSIDSPESEQYLAAAEALYREYVQEAPENDLVLAAFLGKHRTLDAAFEACNKAIADKVPVEQVAQLGLSMLRAKHDKVNEKLFATELGWLKQNLEKDPESITANLMMADFYDMKGDYDQTIAIYRKIKDRKDLTGIARITVLNNLAYILAIRDKRGDEALPLIEEAVKQFGNASELLDTRGMVQLSRGKIREALADLNNAAESGPNPVKFFHLALANLAANDRTTAADNFDKAQSAGLTMDSVPTLERDQFQRLQREFPNRNAAARS